MSSGSLEPGLYHIKSQLSGQYLTVLFPGNGKTVAQPEKGAPFEFSFDGPDLVISFEGIPLGIAGSDVVAQPFVPQVGWKVKKAETQNAWVFTGADESKAWWFDPEEEKNLTIRPLIATLSIPPQYLPTELFVLEKE
ncbi:hypothetical protein BDV40DRAFT_305367 [Aspergillus tamarii]|uniref:Uncharacterized protein n=1 Tax=Aspergillus tamarii TaxID=41984 RepID=A0A5N6UF31_ASPTM|nr:hypothetical protein BDV40DRAFT_305367 [Aspergillus tamarii]